MYRERERKKMNERVCSVLSTLLDAVRATVVAQPWAQPSCLSSLTRDVSCRPQRNCCPRVEQVKCRNLIN